MDTDRDRDIALLEVQEENRLMVEEFMKEKLGKRVRRMMDEGQGMGPQGVEGSYAGDQAPAAPAELGGLPPV